MFKKNWQFFEMDGAGAGDGGTPEPAPTEPTEGAPSLDGAGEAGGDNPLDAMKATLLNNDGEGENKPIEGVPETYEFKLDEGMEIDEAVGSELTAIGKELNISQAGMDKLLTLHNKVMANAVKQAEERVNTDYGECVKQGLTDEANVKAASMFIQNYGSRAALEALTASGVIFNPHVMKMFQSLAMAVKEDKGAGGQPAAQKTDIVDLIYGAK